MAIPRRVLVALLVVVVIALGGWQAWRRLSAGPDGTVLYGNVEIRQVDLAFNAEGRLDRKSVV